MPELPEVETVCRGINAALTPELKIKNVQIYRDKLRVDIPAQIKKRLVGKCILSVRRRAKYLLFEMGDGLLLSHLGMSGSWRWINSAEKRKHDHFAIEFQDGRTLVYHDPRRFGLIDWIKGNNENESKWLKHLGPEPLSEAFTAEDLRFRAMRKKIPVKIFLMDQRVTVGIGNIYASEVLFLAKVSPHRAAGRVRLEEWNRIVAATRSILSAAIETGGTTLRDYVNAQGEKGAFQLKLNVYGRGRQACYDCGQKIALKTLSGRSTFWCRACQK